MGVCAEGQAQLERERSILGQTQDLVVLLGAGEMERVWVAGVQAPQENRLLFSWKEGGRGLRRKARWAPAPGTHTWPASGPRLCPQILLQETGWQQLEQHRAQHRSQALLTLHRGLRTRISRQRLRLLPRMQARVRGLQARSAGRTRPWASRGGRAGTGRHKSQDRFACSPREHLCPYPCSLLEYPQSREAHYWSRPHKPAVLIP